MEGDTEETEGVTVEGGRSYRRQEELLIQALPIFVPHCAPPLCVPVAAVAARRGGGYEFV